MLSNSDEKKWKYNSAANKYLQQFYRLSDKRKIISRGFALHVDYCPRRARIWKGKPYANFLYDCLCCDYFIASATQYEMLCSGRLKIAKIKDLENYESELKKDSPSKIEN